MTTTDVDPSTERDQHVYLHDVSWEDYRRLLAMRGEKAVPRITYLEGEVELMSPSQRHALISRTIARMIYVYADEHELDLTGYGSWTLKKRRKQRGLEPDECFVLGSVRKRRPDLAIEVDLSSEGIDKLEVYRGLGVPEVWYWRGGRIEACLLRGERYEQAGKSSLLPELDLRLLERLVEHPSQSQAAREYRQILRGE